MIRKAIGLTFLVTVSITMLSATALAQAGLEIPRGSGFTVENGTECSPNADVVVFYNEPGTQPRRIGASLSDPSGHFSADVAMPLNAATGPGEVSVECGINGGVLFYDVTVVEPRPRDLSVYVPYGTGIAGALVLLVAVGVWRGRRNQRDEPHVRDAAPAPAELPLAPALEDDADDADDDDNEYWFWDAVTEHGPVKRLACLTDEHFYLHEVPARAFSPLLELLATVGPTAALQSAFFRVAISDIDEIRYRGTEMQVTHRSDDGFVTRTIDLATEVDGVVDLLSRHVPIMEAAGAPGRPE